ncbi:MAG: hypothetical protein Q8O47_03945 [Candidatus Bathyarchaeota archaeon]|nr:hypothetical protein [Candidatus Bathyarchaeota archaeon]
MEGSLARLLERPVGMGPQDAVSAPTVDASGLDTLVDSRTPPNPVEELRKRGHNVKVVEEGPGLSYFARPSAILIEGRRLGRRGPLPEVDSPRVLAGKGL